MNNIINNSVDALKENDQVQKYIFIISHIENDKAIIKIKDNAGGIPEDILDKVFEPYFTTKHKSQGTGLGLYMTHKIITESLNGEIYAANVNFDHNGSSYNGAQFTIVLPLYKENKV